MRKSAFPLCLALFILPLLIILPGCSRQLEEHPVKVANVLASPVDSIPLEQIWEIAAEKAEYLLSHHSPKSGSLHGWDSLRQAPRFVQPHVWTSGFWPARLWQHYQISGKSSWREAARQWSTSLIPQSLNATTHDLGFMIQLPFGAPVSSIDSAQFLPILSNAAYTLAGRYSSTVGMIQSWPANEKWRYPVIVDNLMNLPLLLQLGQIREDSSLIKTAISHGLSTLEHHQRADGSHIHLVDFDPSNGKVLSRENHQGQNDRSCWARGQAWAMYGYTYLWQETQNRTFLEAAQQSARYFLQHLPTDGIPYWDLNLESPEGEPRDAAAAAIAASALCSLYEHDPDVSQSQEWYTAAEMLLKRLSGPSYLDANPKFPFLLLHATGNRKKNHELDTSLIYADYYFFEALLKWMAWGTRTKDMP